MFIAIYRFKVKKNNEEIFIEAWEDLTKLIYRHEGSLGSRLHKSDSNEFIAYAQWPDRATWKNSGDRLPPEADIVWKNMREACEEVENIYELDSISDLLKTDTYRGK